MERERSPSVCRACSLHFVFAQACHRCLPSVFQACLPAWFSLLSPILTVILPWASPSITPAALLRLSRTRMDTDRRRITRDFHRLELMHRRACRLECHRHHGALDRIETEIAKGAQAVVEAMAVATGIAIEAAKGEAETVMDET